ncbi:MAG: Transketolase, partial [Parcubacteria group bacterium GW2011_GWF2_44_7]
VDNGKTEEEKWLKLLEGYKKKFPELAAELEKVRKGDYGEEWKKALPTFSDAMATREASGKVLAAIAPHLPTLIGGSADLTPSNNTFVKGSEEFQPGKYHGRYLRFGVREHAMGSLLNGMALTDGIIPYGGTFLIFSEYMRPPLRLASIMNVRPILVYTHDSIGLGEDGPTHQGMFWMSLYDAYPGIKVYKPLDANEAIEMLFYAMAKGEPVAFSVMRPNTPVFKRTAGAYGDFTPAPAIEAINGAYVFKPFANNGKNKKVLAICGGQVMANTLEILPDLEQGLDIKIIAVTSPELFEEFRRNNPAKAQDILSDEERQYVITLHNGWSGFLDRFILPADYEKRTIEIDRFLKSGPPAEVYKLADFDKEGIKKQILEAL